MIAIINERELERLIKYGTIIVPERNTTTDVDEIKCLLVSTEPFEFSEERVLLKYAPQNETNIIDIVDVECLMAIDKNGFKHYSQYQNIVPIIQIDENIFKSTTRTITKKYCEQNCRNGIHLFRQYCDLKPYADTEFEQTIIKGVETRLSKKHFEITRECRTPWTLLLTYDRYEPYEKDSRGYFLDIEEIMYYLRHPELGFQDNIVEGKKPTSAIRDLNKDTLWNKMVDTLRKNELTQKFMNWIDEKYGSVYVPLLFLYLKEILLESIKNNDFDNVSDILFKVKTKYTEDKYPKVFETVVSLMGGFMGYEKLRKICLGKTIEQPALQTEIEEPKQNKEAEPKKNTSNNEKNKQQKGDKAQRKGKGKIGKAEERKAKDPTGNSFRNGEEWTLFNY